jgi:cyclophilin family peptidyl-prolyl cis-trans isomerase
MAVVLIVGCDRREGGVSEIRVEEKTVSKEPKQMDTGPKKVKLGTSLGDIVIELNEEAAQVTVKNFLRYVEEGFYDGTIFHRVIQKFMIQGGGLTADMSKKQTHPPIVNEASNGLKNNLGSIAMARTNDPDSATSQFFINHENNDFLNYAGPSKPGYAVFGKVIEGMEVVDAIAAVKTTQKGGNSDVPVEPVLIKSVKVVSGK